MQANGTSWVLGHKIRIMPTDDSYALIEVTTPPHTPGPPPHHHKDEREFFLVLKGRLDVMVDGAWSVLDAGDYRELSPGAVHTFANNTGEDTVWVTGWRPKGFERFFATFGIPGDKPDASVRSVSNDIVDQVLARCEEFGMYLAR